MEKTTQEKLRGLLRSQEVKDGGYDHLARSLRDFIGNGMHEATVRRLLSVPKTLILMALRNKAGLASPRQAIKLKCNECVGY